MPFTDELNDGVVVVAYDPAWPFEYRRLEARLRAALGKVAVAIDHIGSTSVPGLAAKNCIDIQVRVNSIDEAESVSRFTPIGFRLRPERHNREEWASGQRCQKLVFAPPPGERAANVHIRLFGGPNSRYALLFRDYLRANKEDRDAWGGFKKRLALTVSDLNNYGQIKVEAAAVLMLAAERWASVTAWRS